MVVADVRFEKGFIVVEKDGAIASRTSMTDILTAANIPILTIGSLELLTQLAELFEILVKHLLDRGVIGTDLYAGYDVAHIIQTLKDSLVTDIGD